MDTFAARKDIWKGLGAHGDANWCQEMSEYVRADLAVAGSVFVRAVHVSGHWFEA